MAKLQDQEVQVEQQAVEVIDAEPKRKWQSYIWDSLNKSPEERHFLFKLDAARVDFCEFGSVVNNHAPWRIDSDADVQGTTSNT
jgi:ACS family pantothenate transporter-like MFS transporter